MRRNYFYRAYEKDLIIIIIIYLSNTPGKPVAAENLGFSWYSMVSRGFLLEMC